MSKKILPYYKWFVQDFRANRQVQKLSPLERGLFRDLLDEIWIEGAIPDDPVKLAEICNCPIPEMTAAWQTLKRFFTAVSGLDGMFLTNTRMEEERSAIDNMRARNSLAGQASWQARQRAFNARSTPVQRLLNGVQPTEQNRTEQNKERDVPQPDVSTEAVVVPKVLELPETGTSWVARMGDMWKAGTKGIPDYPKIGRFLKPLIAMYGEEVVAQHWAIFCGDPSQSLYGPKSFAENFGRYAPNKPKPTQKPYDHYSPNPPHLEEF